MFIVQKHAQVSYTFENLHPAVPSMHHALVAMRLHYDDQPFHEARALSRSPSASLRVAQSNIFVAFLSATSRSLSACVIGCASCILPVSSTPKHLYFVLPMRGLIRRHRSAILVTGIR